MTASGRGTFVRRPFGCLGRHGGSTARAGFDARLAAGGAEPDATLAAGLGMRVNTFLQNFGRARRAHRRG